ncbi:MAG: hypothetical protein JJE28_03700 [Actinomycetales bacterium]|nr:hypothetical protein [Actinomycetales bacterium]
MFFVAAELDPNLVTPGVVGFFATFFIAGMTVLLVFDLVRRIRRSRYREEVGIMLDAEVAAAAQAEAERKAAN